MNMSNTLLIVILFGVIFVLLLALWMVRSRRTNLPEHTPEALKEIADARMDNGERPASSVSEQIEQMVRAKLASDPELADTVLDFATSPEGSLEVWVNQVRYPEIDLIPDARIRELVREAVESFNE
jgi:hypothetical protein